MRLIAGLVLLFLFATSAAVIGAYAYSVGLSGGERWAWAFALASVALLTLECLAGPAALDAIENRRWMRACLYSASLVVAGLTLWSLDLGFASTVFSDARAIRKDGARNTKLAETVTRPSAMVRVDIDMLEAQHKGMSAKWCGSQNENLKQPCEKWMRLRSELIAAETVEANPERTGDADGRAALLSRLSGAEQAKWADFLVVLTALAMTLGRVAAACAVADARRGVPERVPVNAPTSRKIAPEAVFREIEQGVPEVIGTSEVAKVKSEIAKRSKRSSVPGTVSVGFISQRDLKDASSMSMRKTRAALDALQASGEIAIRTSHRGTEISILEKPQI